MKKEYRALKRRLEEVIHNRILYFNMDQEEVRQKKELDALQSKVDMTYLYSHTA